MTKLDTKHSICEAARDLFMKHGIRRITIEDICTSAGICRKTYYDYYNNKLDLVIETLNNLMSDNTNKYLAVIDSHLPFSEKLHRMLDMKIEFMKQNMLLIDDMLLTKMNSVKQFMERKLKERSELIIKHYHKAQKAGEIRSDVCIEAIIEIQNKILDLCSDESFRSKFPDTPTMMRQLSELHLFGIANKVK